MADGVAIAGAKSCELNVQCDAIEKASQTSGRWREFLPGRLEWSLTTGHLVPVNALITHKITSEWRDGKSIFGIDGVKTETTTPYVACAKINMLSSTPSLSSVQVFALNDGESREYFLAWLNAAYNGDVIIFSGNNVYFDAAIANALKTLYGVKFDVPIGFQTSSCAYIGTKGGDGILLLSPAHTQYHTAVIGSYVEAYVAQSEQNTIINTEHPLKSLLTKVGTTYQLCMQVQGFPGDNVVGNAICQQFKATASKSNLLQGSFSWRGTGPLT